MTALATAEPEPATPPSPSNRGRRRTLIVTAVIVVAVAAAAAALRPTPSRRAALLGRDAPGFELPNLIEGQPPVVVPVGQPTVVNFWASWCLPCRKEMPALQAVHRQLGDRVRFVGVDHTDSRADALALARSTGVGYPSGFDPEGNVAGRYGLGGLPSTVLISADGRVEAVHLGPFTADGLRAALGRAFHLAT